MWTLAAAVFNWIVGLFSSSTRKDEIALGKAQQKAFDHDADIAVIRKANQAAQSVSEKQVQDDENNLDRFP